MSCIRQTFVFIVISVLVKGLECKYEKIAHGTEVDPNDFPYLVRINVVDKGFICGGTMFTSKCVLTAAHCLVRTAPTYEVWIGDSKTWNKISDVTNMYVPQKYTLGTYNYLDIGIIKLNKNVQSPYVEIVDVNYERVHWWDKATIVGWGFTEKSRTHDVLRAADVYAVKCSSYFSYEETRHMLCLTGNFGQDACAGDSGGPVMRGGKQVGVVSRGLNCSLGLPGAYTRLSNLEVQQFLFDAKKLC